MQTLGHSRASSVFSEKLRELPQDHVYLIVFHFSKNNLSYLRAWVETVPVLGVISIPYSEQKEVKDEIAKLCPVHSPELKDIPALIVKLCSEHADKKIILVEIGGYSAEVADQLSNVVLAVEDTARGQRQFEEYEHQLTYPVVSIARTNGKKLEDDVVGRAVAQSAARVVEETFGNGAFKTQKVLVMGYGGVGKATAKYLKELAGQVAVYDINTEVLQGAKSAGYEVGEREDVLKSADVVVGCSGHRSVQMEDTPLLKDGVVLISGSSRQVEFPYHELLLHKEKPGADNLVETFKVGEKNVHVAYKGQPINFYFDVALGKVFDIPMTLLAQSVLYGLRAKLENKLYELLEEEEREIVRQLTV